MFFQIQVVVSVIAARRLKPLRRPGRALQPLVVSLENRNLQSTIQIGAMALPSTSSQRHHPGGRHHSVQPGDQEMESI